VSDDAYAAVWKILGAPRKLTPDDIQELRNNCAGFARSPSPFGIFVSARLAVELIDSTNGLTEMLRALESSVNRLNDSSTALVSETNRLTRRILVLTYVAVGMALLGVGIGVLQVTK
jgi:hypothetical protein